MYLEMVTMTVRPENAEAFLALRDAAMAAIRERYPDLQRATLIRVDEQQWVDLVEWASPEQAHAAAEQAPAIGSVAQWLALIEAVQDMRHAAVAHCYTPGLGQ